MKSTVQLAKLSPSKLAQAIERAREACSVLNDQLIMLGRGSELASATRALTKAGDSLAKLWAEAEDTRYDLLMESKRRMAYHGSTKRIK